jgi:hypothetical protein
MMPLLMHSAGWCAVRVPHQNLNTPFRRQNVFYVNDIIIICRVLSGDPAGYGAADSQDFAIYEIFPVFVVSVLLLPPGLLVSANSSF